MSAVNSNSGGRDLEAIERAQRAHEPSMEEILASIRDIIGDERNAAKGAAPKPPHPAPAPTPQIVHSTDAPAPQGDAPELPSARTPAGRRSSGAGRRSRGNAPRTRLSATRRRCCRPRRGRQPHCHSAPCRPISRFAAPSLPMSWCVRPCGRCSSSGSTRTSRPLSSVWCGRKSSGRARRKVGDTPPASRVDFDGDAFIARSGACAFLRMRPQAPLGWSPADLERGSGGYRADQNSMMDKSFDFAAAEGRASALWEETGAFRAGRPDRAAAQPFCVVSRRRTSPAICIWATRSTTPCRMSCAVTGA